MGNCYSGEICPWIIKYPRYLFNCNGLNGISREPLNFNCVSVQSIHSSFSLNVFCLFIVQMLGTVFHFVSVVIRKKIYYAKYLFGAVFSQRLFWIVSVPKPVKSFYATVIKKKKMQSIAVNINTFIAIDDSSHFYHSLLSTTRVIW